MQDNSYRAPALQGATPPSNKWVADIRKNSREVVRVEISRFKDVDIVNLRVWHEAGRDELRPGKSGFALRVSKLPELRDAIDKAITAARDEGLI